MSEQPKVNPGESGSRDVGFITQGLPRRKVPVVACADDASVWVEVRRSYRPWQMTPALARALAGLLREAADAADAMDGATHAA